MVDRLPTKLHKEPLIDAIFEIRFSSNMPASVALPGIFFEKLEGEKTIEPLPLAQIPKQMRDADPNLKFAAINRVTWSDFFVNIGDFSVSVSCKYPYPGWKNFRPAIIQVMDIISASNAVDKIDRYSLKYVDLFDGLSDEQRVANFNLKVSLAGHKLKQEPYQIRLEIPKDGLLHAVQLVSSAKALLHNGTSRDGLVVDVDTIAALGGVSMATLLKGFPKKLDTIHSKNKAMFFDCLTPKTVSSLEPTYE